MEQGAPAALASSGDVVGAIVQIDQRFAFVSGEVFDGFVNFWVRFHHAFLEGKRIAIEMGEKGKLRADMLDCDIVGV